MCFSRGMSRERKCDVLGAQLVRHSREEGLRSRKERESFCAQDVRFIWAFYCIKKKIRRRILISIATNYMINYVFKIPK
jgi:hypothetical protein